ncbi:MAG: restriction endonuclease [Candidatus Kapabacteria bacterium]|nr:restriction endonuclease [Candidatus Kapabacteria bacterium]
MDGSKFIIIERLNQNQFIRFVQFYLIETGYKNTTKIQRKTRIGIDYSAFKEKQKFLIRIEKKNDNIDTDFVISILKISKQYNSDKLILITLGRINKEFSSILEKQNVFLIGQLEIENFLDNRFSSCLEFIEFLNNYGIKTHFKQTTKELIEEYYRIKKLLGKGYVSGLDVRLHSKIVLIAFKTRFGTWKNLLDILNEDTERFKLASADELKEEYLTLKQKLNKSRLTLEDIEIHYNRTDRSYKKYFGSWSKFVEIMEGSFSYSIYTDKDIIDEYFRVKDLLGKPIIRITDMNKYGRFTSGVASWRFGSWTNFLKIINEHNSKYEPLNDNILINEYLKVKENLKKEKITWNDINKYGKYKASTYIYRFGSWSLFLKIMRGEIKNDTYSEFELINEYLRVKSSLNKRSLTLKEFNTNSNLCVYIYKMKFGSWQNFFSKVKVEQIVYDEIKESDFINEYNRIKILLNKKQLKQDEFAKYSIFSMNFFHRFWKTWNIFIEALGENRSKYIIPNEDLILEYLRVKTDFKKEYVSKEFMSKHSNISLGTYTRRYGSWIKFINAMGDETDFLKAKKIEKLKNNH